MAYKSRKKNAYGFNNPLQKLNPLPILAQRDPTTSDFHEIGTTWINETTNDIWVITSVAAGVANWEPVSQSAGGNAPISKYIVDADGSADYTTIQAAIDAANTAGIPATIYIRPGTYTENLTCYDGIELYGATPISQNSGATVTIIGQHTPPTSGHIGFNTIAFINTSHIFNSAAAGTAHLGFFNCESAVQSGYFLNVPNWTGILEIYDCNPNTAGAPFAVDDGGINNQTGSSDVLGFNAGIGFNGTNTMFINGNLFLESGEIGAPLTLGTGANSTMQWMTFDNTVTFAGNSTGFVYFSSFLSGANTAITMNSTANIDIGDCVIDSSADPAIDGAGTGTITLSGIEFIDGSNIAAALALDNVPETRTTNIRSLDVDGRAIVATNTRMRLYQGPVMSTKANTGGAATGATGDENLMAMQQGEIMEQHILGAGQTIIAPRMEADGLLISLDLANNEGAEYSWGFLSSNKHAFTIDTDAPFYFECQLKLADVTGCDPVYIGFRKQEAYQAAFTNYTDFALIGVEESQNSGTITIADQLNTGGVTYTNTTDAWGDGETHTLRVLVDASGNVTYTIDGAAPTATHAFQFDTGDVVMPCIYFLHGAGAPGKIHLVTMEAGYQAWS